MTDLRQELKQSKPFRNIREEAMLNIWRTGDILAHRLDLLLKKRGLTRTQYNFLRILRGAGEDGLPCGDVSERMLTHYPDVTRLVDRLARRGLARRVRTRQDRRVILAKITPPGVDLLGDLESPVAELVDGMMAILKDSDVRTLIRILEELRRR